MNRTAVIVIFIFFFPLVQVVAQENRVELPESLAEKYFIYDEDLLGSAFHKERRALLREAMPPRSVAVFFSHPVHNQSNDVDFTYHQNPDFYYLTGLKEPDAMLLVFKEDFLINDSATAELIFIQDRNEEKETWHGRRLGKKGVEEVLELETVLINSDFADLNINFSAFDKVLYFPLREDVSDNKKEKGDLYSLIRHFRRKTDTLGAQVMDSNSLATLMASLREIKTEEEMELMKKAIDITCEAQRELMRALEPGMTEYQSEAIVEYIFKHRGAEKPGFPSIMGGGENSCILHYTSNRKRLKGDHLLVADIGAEYHGYTADITRTLPVDGKFSSEEKIIYDLVLAAQQAGIEAAIKGNKFWDPHEAATRVIQKGLLDLGIIEKSYQARKYFMHGTSHYLGLDVHDAGNYGSLRPGNVITVEPGIYIPAGSDCDPKWWNIGVRIEDDILITPEGPLVLSASVPRKTEEIEELMKEKSIFNSSK